MQKPGDDGAAGEGADGESDQHGGGGQFVEVMLLVKVVEGLEGGGGDGGGREKEGEARGGFAGEVAEEAGRDRDSATGAAGDDGEGLGESDDEGVGEVDGG